MNPFSATWRRLQAAQTETKASPSPARIGHVLTLREKLVLLTAFALLVLFRLPEAVWHGRLLGEEGPIFLAYAWHRDAWDALWRSFGGYLNLAANASTLLAARLVESDILPLEQVPRVTMGIALAFQLLPAALILWGRGNWLTARWVYTASLLMIVLAPMSEEVWLNVLHIQFHLTLCCALILVLEPPVTLKGQTAQAAILLLAPLCGPGALVLGPVFLARAALDRSVPRMVQTVLLGVGGLAQMLFFFTPSPVRGEWVDLPSLASIIFVRLGALPLTGLTSGAMFGGFASHAREQQDLAWLLFSSLSLAYCAALGWVAWRFRRQPAGWLMASGLCLAVASFGGGMVALGAEGWFNASSGERYNFLPLAIGGIAVVAIAQDQALRSNLIARIACTLILLTGMTSYLNPIDGMAHGPDWRAQAKLWREDRDHVLRGWPAAMMIDLSDNDPPCPPARLDTASVHDPGYCESTWLAGQMVGKPAPARDR